MSIAWEKNLSPNTEPTTWQKIAAWGGDIVAVVLLGIAIGWAIWELLKLADWLIFA